MLRKDVPIEPTDERVTAFNELKAMLTSPPVLAMPADDGVWVVDVDCSAFGVGAVAQQYQNGELKVVEYASRTLNRAERSYCATRRELLGMIFALKHFRSYLLGNHFVCRVDHMALKYYSATPEPLGQQAQFLDFLAEFDFELQYRPGNQHTTATVSVVLGRVKSTGVFPVNNVTEGLQVYTCLALLHAPWSAVYEQTARKGGRKVKVRGFPTHRKVVLHKLATISVA